MREITLKAVIENLDQAMSFVSEESEAMGCGMKAVMSMELVTDEIFSNIAFYAYKDRPEPGDVEIQMERIEVDGTGEIHLTFSDSGIPYDPLAKEDPDVTLSAEEREIGGLGVFLVKKMMDDVKYRYENGRNRLFLVKKL